jgi:hypothetical protein
MLSLLLADDLAEHMLIERASLVNGSLGEMLEEIEESIKTPWSASDIDSMKQSILILCCAAGQPVSHHDTSCTIQVILEKFIVGTEKRKVWKQKCKLPPKLSELAPIASMKLYSTARQAKEKIGRNSETGGDDEDDEDFDKHEDDDEVIEQFTPKYDSVWNLISAADALPDKCNFVG